jgi:hypothetical protein
MWVQRYAFHPASEGADSWTLDVRQYVNVALIRSVSEMSADQIAERQAMIEGRVTR